MNITTDPGDGGPWRWWSLEMAGRHLALSVRYALE